MTAIPAVNYNADCKGTQILYETLSAPICAMRADAAISDDWSQSIEEDYNNREVNDNGTYV